MATVEATIVDTLSPVLRLCPRRVGKNVLTDGGWIRKKLGRAFYALDPNGLQILPREQMMVLLFRLSICPPIPRPGAQPAP